MSARKSSPKAKTPRRVKKSRRPPAPAASALLAAAPPAASETDSTRLPFSTVGIGASAGGLEALVEFFAALPAAAGIALVVVTHQQPDQESLLPQLLARHSSLSVLPATDGLQLRPDRVYVSPPGKNVALRGGALRLSDPVANSVVPLPIDFFFRSLAADQQDHAICIVLSGTGTDGTLGLRAIKGHGGMALAQDERSAQYPGMPMSAAATLLVDRVLPPREMPAIVLRYTRGIRRIPDAPAETQPPSEAQQAVLSLLRRRSGHDFNGYKAAPLARRIERRMRVHQIESVQEYLALLESHPHELDLLFSELLISVTSFFRDPEVFRSLATLLRARLAERPKDTAALRVWVAACSTGEEAYSLAMLLTELGSDTPRRRAIQVFATDIDSNVIEHARLGVYPEGIAADVGPERLQRFLVRDSHGYRISQEIRELCVFAVQSVLRDPPFTKLALLSCRNLLIYLDPETQKRLIPLFHYALEPGGLLLLGSSETIGGFERLFRPVDRRHRIYERLPQAADATALIDWHALWPVRERAMMPGRGLPPFGITHYASQLLLERFAPPTLIVNAHADIVYVHGRTGPYLELSSGEPQTNLMAMARADLRRPLAAVLRRASHEDGEIVHRVKLPSPGEHTTLDVIVQRLSGPDALRGLFRVSLDPSRAEPAPRRVGATRERARTGSHLRLESELQLARAELQGTVEELQSSNEELKSMNEELQSTNEELQSSNEELQTSREELKSMNEELQTVNVELQDKMGDLSRANDDMANLLESTDIATLFLDRQLRIKRFTELAREVINLIPGDIGRPVGDLVSNLCYAELRADAQRVLDTLQTHEVEVETNQGQWRLVRIIPYRTSRNVIDGVTIHFLDIDRIKRVELLAASRALAECVVQTVREPLAVLDADLNIATANPAFLTLFDVSAPATGQYSSLFDIGAGVFGASEMRAQLERLLGDGEAFQDVPIEYGSPRRGPLRLLASARRLLGALAPSGHILLALDERSGARCDPSAFRTS